MPRIGDLAREDTYYDPMTGMPIGAAVGEPKVTDYGQADLRPFAMGALAQQRDYQPTDAKGGDLWGYQTAGGLTTPQDVERATQMALAFSGGGLKTKSVPELGALLDPKGGSGNWMIRHVEGQPVMADVRVTRSWRGAPGAHRVTKARCVRWPVR